LTTASSRASGGNSTTPDTTTRDILTAPYLKLELQFYHVSTIYSGLDNEQICEP
jgi:hypothetical protein